MTTTPSTDTPRIDVRALRGCLLALQDAYAGLRTPWKPAIEVDGRDSAPGPREPIPASVLDAEQAVERILRGLWWEVSVTMTPLPDVPAHEHPRLRGTIPRPLSPWELFAWCYEHAPSIVALTSPDVLDYLLCTLTPSVRRMAGQFDLDRETAAAERQNALRRKIGLAPDTYTTAPQAARLVSLLGHHADKRSIKRWVSKGLVRTQEGANVVEVSVSDCLDQAKKMNEHRNKQTTRLRRSEGVPPPICYDDSREQSDSDSSESAA